jgi:hypothetical protein
MDTIAIKFSNDSDREELEIALENVEKGIMQMDQVIMGLDYGSEGYNDAKKKKKATIAIKELILALINVRDKEETINKFHRGNTILSGNDAPKEYLEEANEILKEQDDSRKFKDFINKEFFTKCDKNPEDEGDEQKGE